MILSFKKQFKPLILTGSKIHTIRADPHNRWKPGRKIHMATGIRTRNYNCFKESVCASVQSIEIKHGTFGIKSILIDDVEFYDAVETNRRDFIKKLSKNDGFSAIKDFRQWFSSDFSGKIVHWTYFRY